jgi:outer membrane protein assembly factor BamA
MHLKENEYLLRKNKINIIGLPPTIDKEDVAAYIRQKPNRSVLFGQWQIGLQWKNIWYNPEKGKVNPAVILDTNMVKRSEQQITLYFQKQGYFKAKTNAVIKQKHFWGFKRFPTKKKVVSYNVELNERTVVDSMSYVINDKIIQGIVSRNMSESFVKKDKPFTTEKLESERTRLTEIIRNSGYYDFSESFIKFKVDTFVNPYKAIVLFNIQLPNKETAHSRYKIRNVYIHSDYQILQDSAILDTTEIEEHTFIIHYGRKEINEKVLFRSNFIQPNEFYSVQAHNDTYRQFANLQLFRSIKITYDKIINDESYPELDVNILLSTSKFKSLSAEATVTFREGFGGNGQISYVQKNMFHKADIFDFSIVGGVENLKSSADNSRILGANIGPQFKWRFPGLLFLPGVTQQVRKNYFPKSSISGRYNYQRRIDYTRYLSQFSLGYEWNEGRYKKHEIYPLDISFSFISKGSRILESLNDLSLSQKFRFEDHIISGIKYRFLFNNQQKDDVINPVFLTAQAFLMGPSSILFAATNNEARNEDGAITLGGIRYANFFKLDVDVRKYFKFTEDLELVYRWFSGAGISFDNKSVVPFDQLYFAGGANSIRGWQQRTLGPGALFEPDNVADRLGEIKIENNVEIRFPFTQIIKGGLFVDAGNIWNYNNEIEESNFKFNSFYKQIAVASGFGLRLDFEFLLFRIDLAYPIKKPYKSNYWHWYYDEPNFNFGIGYPF